MKRSTAGRAIRDSSLRSNEKLIMLALLDRADNEDCAIPAWRSPSLLAVEKDTSLSHATVLKTLAHLELHGWLQRDGAKRGQVAGTKRAGMGRSATRWSLLPGAIPGDCSCPKPDRSARDQSRTPDRSTADQPDWSTEVPVPAGQDPDRTKGGREGESKEWEWPDDTIGSEVNGRMSA